MSNPSLPSQSASRRQHAIACRSASTTGVMSGPAAAMPNATAAHAVTPASTLAPTSRGVTRTLPAVAQPAAVQVGGGTATGARHGLAGSRRASVIDQSACDQNAGCQDKCDEYTRADNERGDIIAARANVVPRDYVNDQAAYEALHSQLQAAIDSPLGLSARSKAYARYRDHMEALRDHHPARYARVVAQLHPRGELPAGILPPPAHAAAPAPAITPSAPEALATSQPAAPLTVPTQASYPEFALPECP